MFIDSNRKTQTYKKGWRSDHYYLHEQEYDFGFNIPLGKLPS